MEAGSIRSPCPPAVSSTRLQPLSLVLFSPPSSGTIKIAVLHYMYLLGLLETFKGRQNKETGATKIIGAIAHALPPLASLARMLMRLNYMYL